MRATTNNFPGEHDKLPREGRLDLLHNSQYCLFLKERKVIRLASLVSLVKERSVKKDISKAAVFIFV